MVGGNDSRHCQTGAVGDRRRRLCHTRAGERLLDHLGRCGMIISLILFVIDVAVVVVVAVVVLLLKSAHSLNALVCHY